MIDSSMGTPNNISAKVTINDVTIAAIDSSDAQIYSVLISNTNTATVFVTGASPAAAVDSTETVAVSNGAAGSIFFGTAGDATKPGFSSDVLSNLAVTNNAGGYVDLGVIASVDSNDFTLSNTGTNTAGSTTLDFSSVGQAGDE